MFFLFSVYGRFLLVYILGAGLLTSALSVLMLYFLTHLLVSNSEPIYIVAMVRMIWKLSLVPIILVAITFAALFLAWHPTNNGSSIHQLHLYPVDISYLYI